MHVLLGEVVLGAGGDAAKGQRVVVVAGQGDDGHRGGLIAQPLYASLTLTIGQIQVQKHRLDRL